MKLIRPLTDAEKAAGICEVCMRQPCVCALVKDPWWIDRLEIESDLQAIEDCCDKFAAKYAGRDHPLLRAAHKTVNECAEVMALAREIIRNMKENPPAAPPSV